MRKLKKGDPVIVIAWKHKGVKSRIIKIQWDRVYLHDVNKVKKAVKWQWFIEKEAPIHISNVAYLDGDKPSRVGIKIDEKTGKKTRYAKKSGSIIKDQARSV